MKSPRSFLREEFSLKYAASGGDSVSKEYLAVSEKSLISSLFALIKSHLLPVREFGGDHGDEVLEICDFSLLYVMLMVSDSSSFLRASNKRECIDFTFGKIEELNDGYKDSIEIKSIFDLIYAIHNNTVAGIFLYKDDKFTESLRNVIHEYVNILSNNHNDLSRRVKEGLAEGEPDPMSDKSKLDNSELAPTFSGAVDRQFVADLLTKIMDERELTIRSAGQAAGVSHTEIQRIKDCKTSLEKSIPVLSKLGCTLTVHAEIS